MFTTPLTPEAQLARKIENRMAAKGASRRSVYLDARMTRRTFELSMSGERSFTINELMRIASVLDVPVSAIMPEEFTSLQESA